MNFAGWSKGRLIVCLAITQLIGWGATFDTISVLANPISTDFGIDRELLYFGPTLFLIVTALAGPAVGRLVKRIGARPVLTLGNLVMAVGLVAMALAANWYAYVLGWGILGLGGSLGLGSPAFAAVVERDSSNPKQTIGVVLIFAGLSTAASWPLFTFLQGQIGWRASLLAAALVVAAIAAPLVWFGLTSTKASNADVSRTDTPPVNLIGRERAVVFVLLATASTLFSVVSFGMSPSLIDIIGASGATSAMALGLASFRSVLGIGARIADVTLGRRGDALLTSLVAVLSILTGVMILGVLSPHPAASVLFVIFYGIGSGIATLARAVLPLNFFSASEFAVMAGKIQLPQNIGTAFAPLIFNAILTNFGFQSLVAFTSALLILLLCAVLMLYHFQRRSFARAAATV
ncbi:MFS transporter [Rhizobium lemnae]|uniref:MFS transporter n=1 Tax=Rhizobium lemnae TaxID=1214924 RepID=A0ABV8EHQ8_9HYPH|nr:MFS transporter [Rhizobium lemnae]MCJ8510526.1 MFS transporter [Rhizobium lemnae]